jgi:MFS family permease
MIVGAMCIASIGLAQNFWQLAVLQAVGVMATGMYHPIGTALAGQIGTRFLRNGRGQAIGLFIAAGMLGQAVGPILASRINQFNAGQGMPWLVILIPPTILAAAILHAFTRRVAHRHGNHHDLRAAFSHDESRRRWGVITLLTAQNSLRFTTNVGLFAMFNVWAKSKILSGSFASEAERASAASALTGALASGLTIGMGIAVILGGRLVKRGDEKMPLFWLSILGAIGTISMGYVGDWSVARAGGTTWLALLPVHICGAIAAMGFFATFPIATSLAQRLQPGHTGMVTSLMMGVGWGISAAAAPLAQLFFGGIAMDHAPTLPSWRINIGFLGFGALLLVAGALTLLIPRDLIHKATEHH